MKKPKRILCAVLALLMLLGAAAAVSVRPAYATKTEAELEEEQRKAAQVAALEQKKKEQQEKLKDLEKQIAEAGCRTRSDSVRVVEALVTASPEFFKGKKNPCQTHKKSNIHKTIRNDHYIHFPSATY